MLFYPYYCYVFYDFSIFLRLILTVNSFICTISTYRIKKLIKSSSGSSTPYRVMLTLQIWYKISLVYARQKFDESIYMLWKPSLDSYAYFLLSDILNTFLSIVRNNNCCLWYFYIRKHYINQFSLSLTFYPFAEDFIIRKFSSKLQCTLYSDIQRQRTIFSSKSENILSPRAKLQPQFIPRTLAIFAHLCILILHPHYLIWAALYFLPLFMQGTSLKL